MLTELSKRCWLGLQERRAISDVGIKLNREYYKIRTGPKGKANCFARDVLKKHLWMYRIGKEGFDWPIQHTRVAQNLREERGRTLRHDNQLLILGCARVGVLSFALPYGWRSVVIARNRIQEGLGMILPRKVVLVALRQSNDGKFLGPPKVGGAAHRGGTRGNWNMDWHSNGSTCYLPNMPAHSWDWLAKKAGRCSTRWGLEKPFSVAYWKSPNKSSLRW